MKKEKYNQIYLLGDIHGNFNFVSGLIKHIEEDSLIIQLGDFGVGFRPSSEKHSLNQLNDLLDQKKITLYAIRGNHENPDCFNNPAKFGFNLSRIQLLPDYTYKEINDKKFAFVGGAVSIDRYIGSSGVDWWDGEGVKLNDKYEKSDILISHTAPSFCDPIDSDANLWNAIFRFCFHATSDQKQDMFNDLRDERKKLDEIVKGINPSNLYYGHFHFSAYRYIESAKLHARLLDINEWVKL